MRAAIVTDFASPPAAGEFADPVADEGQIAVDVELAALNPVDIAIYSGSFYAARPDLPCVAGREGIARLDDGSLAYFDLSIAPFGSIAERTLVANDLPVRLPDGLDPAPALACGIAGLAAYLALTARAKLTAGERVLILGAGGAVGQVGIVAAQLLGASRVVGAARRPHSLERARALGVDATVELQGDREAVAAAISAAFDGEGPDVVVDPLWGMPAAAAVDAMAFGGRLVQLGQSAGKEATFDSAAVRGKCLKILGHTNFAVDPAVKLNALETLFEWTLNGQLEVPHERFPLGEVGDAWQRQIDSPGMKLVIDPHA